MNKTITTTLFSAILLAGLFAAPASAMIIKGDSVHDLHALIEADLKKISNRENGVGSFKRYFGDISVENEAALQAVLDKAGVERPNENRMVID